MAKITDQVHEIKRASDGYKRSWLPDGSLPDVVTPPGGDEYSVSGTIAHKSDVTISSQSGLFGTALKAANSLYDLGQTCYENGVASAVRQAYTENTAIVNGGTDPWSVANSVNSVTKYDDNIRFVKTSRPLRHSRSEGHLLAFPSGGFVGYPQALQSITPAEQDYLYYSTYRRHSFKWTQIHSFGYTSKTGAFDVPTSPGALGGPVTIDGVSTPLYLVHDNDDGTKVSVYSPEIEQRLDGVGGFAGVSVVGATLTCTNTGNTCVLTKAGSGDYADDWAGAGAPEKISRIENDTDSAHIFTLDRQYHWPEPGDLDARVIGDEWYQVEVLVSRKEAKYWTWVNGAVIYDGLPVTETYDATGIWALSALGWQPIRAAGNTVEIADTLVLNDRARVYLGNAATWGACTKRELQLVRAWTPGQLDITLLFNSIADAEPKWLYAVNAPYPQSTDAGVPLQ